MISLFDVSINLTLEESGKLGWNLISKNCPQIACDKNIIILAKYSPCSSLELSYK